MGQPNTPPGGEQKGGGYTSILFLLVLIVVFYLFFIRPQVKKSKDQRNFQEGISKGDKVITVGGIHGKVVEVHETAVTIDTGNGNKLKVEKSAISMENSTPSQSGRK
ncbi:MAG: preprotein translocase subunit YajC [Bacteroidetes bacterium]|nr:MAG: preprotein translocase subunit YajC [Bacteroidota bacterium]